MDNAPEQAWLDGRAAGLARVPMDANPHAAGTELARDWLDGWLEGERQSLVPADDPPDRDEPAKPTA